MDSGILAPLILILLDIQLFFAGNKNDRKSISGTCQILDEALISWHRKKKTSAELSTTESEYLAIESCGTQLLWMMHQLLDYDLSYKVVPILCDNIGAISLSKYVVHHSRSKHIDIKHHFIRDHVENENFVLELIASKNQLADIFTKPLLEERFCFIQKNLGISYFKDLY